MPFDNVESVAELMAGFPHPWFVGGGWAIDLFLGRQTRSHGSVEITVFREDHVALREWLGEWKAIACYGAVNAPWEVGETLPPPVHEARARRVGGDPDQLGIRVETTGKGYWFYHRNRLVSLPVGRFGATTPDGVPYVSPEVVLLLKAVRTTRKDERDFCLAIPSMTGNARLWLRRAVATAHVDHAWRSVLDAPVLPPLTPPSLP